jgi:DNA-binding MarR family transcriptional regulator
VPILRRREPTSPTARLLSALHGATQAAVARIGPDLEAEGLTSCTFWALYRLGSGGADHPGAIARQLGVTKPSVTQSVDQLVDAGLVVRSRTDEDRRVVRLELTAEGRRTLGRVLRRLDYRFAEALEGLPRSGVAGAAEVLERLAAHLQDPGRPSPIAEAA